MNRPRFQRFLDVQFERIKGLSGTKGKEYATDEDVHADFNEVATELGTSAEQALMTYALKHWRAIQHYVREGHVKSEPIEGRIDDLILYLILFRAMLAGAEEEMDDVDDAVRAIG